MILPTKAGPSKANNMACQELKSPVVGGRGGQDSTRKPYVGKGDGMVLG